MELDDVLKQEKCLFLAVKYRLTALYHNCKSASAFAMHDAEIEKDDVLCKVRRSESSAYECCAVWLKAMIDDMPNKDIDKDTK